MQCGCGQASQDQDSEMVVFAIDAPRTLQSPEVNKVATPSQLLHPESLLPPNRLSEAFTTTDKNDDIRYVPRVDAFFNTKEESLVLLFDVAGLPKEEITVEAGHGVLTVSGTRAITELHDSYGEMLTMHIQERPNGSFYRQFRLPPNSREESTCAGIQNGVLEIKINCIQTQELRTIPIVDGKACSPEAKKEGKK